MFSQKQTIRLLIAASALAAVAFTIPFFAFHKGLPTGDSQKSIIWAQPLLATGTFPDYQTAITNLNRDPVDFYTPALHLLTAGLLLVGGLPAVGLVTIAATVATALLGAAIAGRVTPAPLQNVTALVAFFLTITQERFLRYVREPGYHFQNIIGELLLFTLLLLGLKLIDRWRWKTFAVAVALGALLVLSHQFSAFLAAFVLLPLVLALAWKHRRVTFSLLPVFAIFVIGGIFLGLHEKIPHIFTLTPHLLSQTPSPLKVLQLMQPAWFLVGLGGLILLAKKSFHHPIRATFIASSAILLLLSQGPRFGLDIPPVRALLYTVVPLSITGAYLIARLVKSAAALLQGEPRPLYGRAALLTLAAFLLIFSGNSATHAFTLSHIVRTNSTLTPGIQQLADYIRGGLPRGEPGELYGVLIDDYNRRSASWLVLSGHPMYTRIAADLETQMNEARQNELRKTLYLNQLDFEKIFSLGSRPEILTLMQKHNITWLTGIDGSSVSHFQHNPALQAAKNVDYITLFAMSERSQSNSDRPGARVGRQNFDRLEASELTHWLLKPSTLVNDIGDLEDTYQHLPASLRATRLSDPLVDGHTTFRTTTAPLIPLVFNVGDYVRVLWDQDSNNLPDASLQLYIQYVAGQEQRKISPEDARIDDHGFITITLKNPTQRPLSFDLIALGLAHTP